MYNETIRKITSLTLLTILVASSAVVGMPNALPHVQAQTSTNANLFVSAENSQFNNYFAGPQVIQVVVADPDINRLDQAYGEPVVTVNGKRLRMAQGTDGNWYAYFADRNQAIAASNTAEKTGMGLNFGGFCSPTSTFAPKAGVTFTDTKGFTVARGGFGSINHTNIAGGITVGNLPTCTSTPDTLEAVQMEHVVRENKTLNNNLSGFAAPYTTYSQAWPIIQLYDFSAIPSAVTVDYQKNGGDQIVNLTFDRIPQNLITTTIDRNAYPQNANVFVQVNDPQLNIDPTEDDSWTWGTSTTNNTLYYQAFNRNGGVDADGTPGMQNLVGNLTTLMFNHNGKLTFTPAAQSVRVTDFQANGKIIYTGTQRNDPALVSTNSITAGSQPLTLIEQGGVNTGVFGSWDGGKKSEIVTRDSPVIRGQSSIVRYNDISTSIVGGFSFASLTQTAQNNTWASGQRIPVILTDNDENKNGKISERMFLWDPTYKRSAAMVIGTPFTLSSGGVATEVAAIERATPVTIHGIGNLTFGSGPNATGSNIQEDEAFSARPIFNFTNATLHATINSQVSSLGPALGTASTFGVLGYSTVTNTGTSAPSGGTVITGDLGLYPGTSVTGFSGTLGPGSTALTSPLIPGTVTGLVQIANTAANNARNDADTAYIALQGATCTTTYGVSQELSAVSPLSPGVYCDASGFSLTGALTLNGAGLYIFKSGSTIVTTSPANVILAGGATADNVFWAAGSSVTLAKPASGTVNFPGTVIALASISQSGTTTGVLNIVGRLIALNGAVTFADSTAVTVPTVKAVGDNALFVDLKTTMSTLLKTIHNTNRTNNIEGFKGFNFLNYDLRSFSSLNGATGGSISNVHVYLVYRNDGSPLSSINGLATAGSHVVSIANSTNLQDFINLNSTDTTKIANPAQINKNLFGDVSKTASIGLLFVFTTSNGNVVLSTNGEPIVADFFSVGLIGDGTQNSQRINNGIYRYELQETGDNTGVFTGTNQFVMLNQLNIFDPNTYSSLRTINHDVFFPAIQDMLQSEARAPQITYLDLGQDGVNTQISAQQDIPTHTGVISFDSKTYKIGDTVTITLNDQDLNVNNDLVDIYTAVTPALNPTGSIKQTVQDNATDTIGKAGLGQYSDGSAIGRLVDIQFGQANVRWSNSHINSQFTPDNTASCFTNSTGAFVDSNTGTTGGFATSLSATGFSLVETGPSTGIFTGTFEIPDQLCQSGVIISSVGQNIKVNYVDFRDSSGKLVEVSDNSGIRGNTGSVKLDKAVYPVPFGQIYSTAGITGDFKTPLKSVTSEAGVFPMHRDLTGSGLTTANTLSNGDVIIHIRVNDQDFNTSPVGTDKIALGVNDINHGPVAVQITRQSSSLLLATAGGPAVYPGKIVNLNGTGLPAIATGLNDGIWNKTRDLGPMVEIAPDAGIFQADLPIRFTDGPQGTDCPTPNQWTATDGTTGLLESDRFHTIHSATSTPTSGNYCVRQGDVLTVTYTDLNDASGNVQTVTDSSTFDLRNGVLQSDKSVYIIGSDMILTLVEPDLNLDSQTAETIPLDVIEWDSHAFKGTMGLLGGQSSQFDAKPGTFVETGKDTGIFQSIIKVPKQLNNNLLERGEQITLEYTDWGPAGSKVVGANSQDIDLTIYTSNFGATVELDQKVYTWTDRVYITVVAPDHNFDPNLIDTIGSTNDDKVSVSTRGNSISNYKLVETGVDTGIFTGYVILTGNQNVKGTGGVDGNGLNPTGAGPSGAGPTDGFLPSEEQDGVSVSFEFTRDQTVTGSALIRWNIGEIKWLEASYPANGQGVLQIVDPDMNLNPKAVDKFDTNVWSDSDSGGIKLTMTETGEATGIFQGTVYFTTNFQSSGNRLHVAEGDTVTGEYNDRTLPPPYTSADQLRLTSTTFIGTVVPPLERAPASNPRIVDSFGNAITGAVKTGQQVQVTADLANGQDKDQPFAYLVQIQDANGVTVSLSWITGTLTAGQSLNPAQSWTPTASGTYTAQIFVWQSIDNPNALSPPLTTTINVA
ncbi:MAG: ice-binding family protein [Nitrosotalea sp.]